METLKCSAGIWGVFGVIAVSLAFCDCGGAPGEALDDTSSAVAAPPFSGLVPICDAQPAQAPIGLCFSYPIDGGASTSTSVMYVVSVNGTENDAPFCPGTTSTLPPVTVAAELPRLIASICGDK